jgi:hypothetical protein
MIDITVTVKGPGGVISQEMILIRRALEAAGIAVSVEDAHINLGDFADEEAYLAHGASLRDPKGEYAKKYGHPLASRVKLIANHLPWGG